MENMTNNLNICVIGLGYVGLPLALELSKHFVVYGLDNNKDKIKKLKNFIDPSGEVIEEDLKSANINFSEEGSDIKNANFIIVCVPTPIDKNKNPDLTYLKNVSRLVGENLKQGSIVVYESTVYPGVTEEVCVPIIEKYSDLKCGHDFKVGYSPERMNPGDKERTITNIVKVVSGMDEESAKIINYVYSKVTNTHLAPTIKVAEAAKVIENVQRDLNIALVNELSVIFNKMDINVKDVLDAAGTKWNFHNYSPGLVGGHCIGVDPYYLTYKAVELGYHPEVILAGRRINDNMPKHVVNLIIRGLNNSEKVLRHTKVALLGLSFKENVKDYRNSKASEIIQELKSYGMNVYGVDPLLGKETIENIFNVEHRTIEELKGVDCLVLLSPHNVFKDIDFINLKKVMAENPVFFDLKNIFSKEKLLDLGFSYISL